MVSVVYGEQRDHSLAQVGRPSQVPQSERSKVLTESRVHG
jgi:hypothetical protein